MRESTVSKHIRLIQSEIGKIWRNNIGLATYRIKTCKCKVISRVPYGVGASKGKGGSDLIGITTLNIKPEHVGKKIGVFTAIEVKGPRTPTTPEQWAFLDTVAGAGGIAVHTKDPEDLKAIHRAVRAGQAVWGKVWTKDWR